MVQKERCHSLAGHHRGKPSERPNAGDQQQRRGDHHNANGTAEPDPEGKLTRWRGESDREIARQDGDQENDHGSRTEGNQRGLQRVRNMLTELAVDARLGCQQTTGRQANQHGQEDEAGTGITHPIGPRPLRSLRVLPARSSKACRTHAPNRRPSRPAGALHSWSPTSQEQRPHRDLT